MSTSLGFIRYVQAFTEFLVVTGYIKSQISDFKAVNRSK